MKSLFLFLGLILSVPVFANVGFVCPELNLKIIKTTRGADQTIVIQNLKDQTEIINPRIILPQENSTDAYQERYAIYYSLMTEAQINFPYMPEILLVTHMARSTKAYKAGFKAFEGEGKSVELKKMYCQAFIKAVEKF